MTQNPNLAALSAAGVSVWLDDLSRERLQTGNLQELIDTKSVVGVTTNPSIFQAALSKGNAYDAQVNELAERGADVDATIRTVTTDDVRNACDVLAKQYEASDGVDGRVSIEVDPRLAHDTDKTIAQAIELWKIVDRPNLLIKIPATHGRAARDHRGDRRGHLGQRDADLLGRAAPRGDGRLPRRPGEGQGGRPRPVQDPFRRIVLRLPRGHRDRQAAGEDRHRRGAGAARPGRRRQRPAGLRGLRGGVRRRCALRGAEGRRRPGAAAAVGVHRREEPRLLRHPVRHRAGRTEHREHHAGEDDGRGRRPRRHHRRHRHRHGRRRRRRSSTSSTAVGIDLPDVFQVLEDEGVEKFEKSWQELLDATQGQLDAARNERGQSGDPPPTVA